MSDNSETIFPFRLLGDCLMSEPDPEKEALRAAHRARVEAYDAKGHAATGQRSEAVPPTGQSTGTPA